MDMIDACHRKWECRSMEIELAQASAKLVEQQNEIERLRVALKEIAKVTYGFDWTWSDEEMADYYSMRFFNAQQIARAALEEK